MKILQILSVMTVTLALFTGCAGNTWSDFTPDEGSFTVQMPGAPEKRQETRDGIDGTVWFKQEPTTNTVYMAGFFDYPPEENPSFTILDSAVAAYENQPGTTVIVREVRAGEHAGREMQAQVFGGPTISARFYLVESRLYAVTATTPPGRIPPDEVKRFLDSFQPLS